MEKYCLSKYNEFHKHGNSIIGVNLYKHLMFNFDIEKYDLLIAHKSNLTALKESSPLLFSTMYKLGIIEDKELNVPDIHIMKNRQQVFSNESFRLIINPTLNCNFSCWYCYETHSKKRMDKETVDAVIKQIELLITKKKISRLHIDWFGGEPLICFETVIKPISIAAKKLCAENNVNFMMSMTTNGFFIKEQMISFFEAHNLWGFQITLDGNKEKHNLTRFYGKDKKGSFDTVVGNICLLAAKMAITLRINYTKDSLDNCEEIIDCFPEIIRHNIKIILVQVWQDRSQNNETNRTELNKQELTIYKNFREAGFQVNMIRFSCGTYCSCYADSYNEAIINYDGRVFKCTTADFEKDKEDGILTIDGEIIWDEDRLAKRLSKATFDNKICMECEYLPICNGGCSKNPIVKVMQDKKCRYKPRLKQSIKEIMIHFGKKNYKIRHLEELKQEISSQNS